MQVIQDMGMQARYSTQPNPFMNDYLLFVDCNSQPQINGDSTGPMDYFLQLSRSQKLVYPITPIMLNNVQFVSLIEHNLRVERANLCSSGSAHNWIKKMPQTMVIIPALNWKNK